MTTALHDSAELRERARALIPPVLSHRGRFDVVEARGSWIETSDGRQLLDFSTGIACLNLGHNHPDVVRAARDQLDSLWHAGWGTYLYSSLVDAAEKIVSVTPNGIEQVLFMNSGAEAVEAAVKLARRTSGRQGVVVFRGGFHGRTMGSVSYTTSKAAYRYGYHPLVPSVFVTSFPHPFEWQMSQEEADAVALDELSQLFKHQVTPGEVAAFLVEPMQGEGGYYPASTAFLTALREIADRHGILLIADEVQTGFGRTGDWFASQTLGVEPDILVMGKAIANGLPLSAIGSSKAIFADWKPGSHGTTYGGNPVACAAASAVVDGLVDVIPGIAERSRYAMDRFEELKAKYPVVRDVRGLGLMIGVELIDESGEPSPAIFESVAAGALENGLFILPCGPDGNVIRFIPPLNVSREDLERGIDMLQAGLESAQP